MISAIHTAETADTPRQKGMYIKCEAKVHRYDTCIHSVDSADQYSYIVIHNMKDAK